MASVDEVLSELSSFRAEDVRSEEGKLFAYVYETGDEKLSELSAKACALFHNVNCLDFTVFRSVVKLEHEVVSFAKKLVSAPEGAVGTFTLGGTESIMLAVLCARELFRSKGKKGTPNIVAPITAHPAFLKSAFFLGMKVKFVPVRENGKVHPEKIGEAIDEQTALVVASAPNWAFGVIDPIREIAKITREKDIPLHVDACLGGFILPFFRKLGLDVPDFDFSVDGVTSISLDFHKYGYAPKGASAIIFRNEELKKLTIFVDVKTPGYVFVNQTVLSSRPAGPLAGTFAVIRYLGEEGYIRFARDIVDARDRIHEGMRKLGFESIGPLESPILCLTSEHNLLNFAVNMKRFGWQIHVQRAVKECGIPPSVHLALMPIHKKVADRFVEDAQKSLKIRSEFADIRLPQDLDKVLSAIVSGKLDAGVIPLLLDWIPSETAVELIKSEVVRWFERG